MTVGHFAAPPKEHQHQFIEAGPPFSAIQADDFEYNGLLQTETFDHEAYLHEFIERSHRLPPVGVYRLRDVDVTGQWMLLSRDDHGHIYSLPGMGWTQEHIDLALAEERSLKEVTKQRQVRKLAGTYMVLSCPGAFTFGHVLVDISLRIQLAKAMGLFAGVKFLIQSPVHQWYLPFLSIAGISIEDCVLIGRGEQCRVEEIYVPTWTGVNGVLNRSVAHYGFRRMKEVINNILGPEPKRHSVVFPLHTTMSSIGHPRGVLQREAIVDTLQRRFGVEAFNPLELSFAEQVGRFREARLVIGEDSSALHNVLWSNGADLAVLAPRGYFNYYHIGIQSINGGRTAITWGDILNEKSGTFQINLDALCRTLDSLLQE